MKLDEYKRKRDFAKTKEPAPNTRTDCADQMEGLGGKLFVIQKHNARRIHFDFRIEHEGVLKSWAVPKGLSSDPKDKRLAVQTEDHPITYANFSGTIPKGEYGGGTVEIWDKGKYVNITIKNSKVQPLGEAMQRGHFLIYIKGSKLEGTYAFTRTDEKNWIIVKKKEASKVPASMTINGNVIKITNAEKELDAGIRKSELVDYYAHVAPMMLKHIKDRLISMLRFPGGVNGKKFFQKNAPDYFPPWMPTRCIKDKSGQTCYTTVKNEAGIVYLGNQVVEPHIMVSRIDELPDKMVFDLDPSKEDIKELKDAALMLKDFLDSIKVKNFIMTSGGKGYHIAVPIKKELDNDEVRAFALKIASALVKNDKTLTTELLKDKRRGRIFIDVNRISENQTSICPYGARARPRLPIACPFHWDELLNIDPTSFTIRNYPKEDAWEDFFKDPISLKSVIERLKT